MPDNPDSAPIYEITAGPAHGGKVEGVRIKTRDGGYSVTSDGGYPVIEYDRSRYKLLRDPASTEQVERFAIVPKD